MLQTKRIVFWLLSGSILVVLFLLTTCASLDKTTAHAGDLAPHTVMVNLRHAPDGSASLRWDPGTKMLTVAITLTGMAPNSTHPAHIHAGVCTSNGPVVYPLKNVVANAAGNGASTTTISGIAQGIPASGWYINVHNGPHLSPAEQFIPIACGNISNPHNVHMLTLPLGSTNAADQNVSGHAMLTLSGKTLIVTVSARGLVPRSTHPEHIHAGSCQNQVPGSVVHPLNNLVADSSGNATARTVINNVTSIPATGWYINVHRNTALASQTGFDPIACGNVRG